MAEDYPSQEQLAYEQAVAQQQYNQSLFTPQEDRTDLLLYTFYHGDVLTQLKKALMGEIRDSKGSLLVVRKPLLNDIGINEVMIRLQLAVSKLTNLSDINEDEVYKLAKGFEHNIVNDLWINKINWGMTSSLITVKDLIGDVYFLTLKRAQEGGDRGLIGKTHRSADTRNFGTGGGKSGMMSNVMKGLFK